jgi:putative transcriptional regulator
MPLRWRVDPLSLLKEKGYSSYRIRKENLFNQSTMKCLRYKMPVSWKDLEKLCELTGMNIGKLIEYTKKTD